MKAIQSLFLLKGLVPRRVSLGLPWNSNDLFGKDKLFQLQKISKQAKDSQHFKQVTQLIDTKVRSAFDNYLHDLLGLAAQNVDESPSGYNPK